MQSPFVVRRPRSGCTDSCSRAAYSTAFSTAFVWSFELGREQAGRAGRTTHSYEHQSLDLPTEQPRSSPSLDDSQMAAEKNRGRSRVRRVLVGPRCRAASLGRADEARPRRGGVHGAFRGVVLSLTDQTTRASLARTGGVAARSYLAPSLAPFAFDAVCVRRADGPAAWEASRNREGGRARQAALAAGPRALVAGVCLCAPGEFLPLSRQSRRLDCSMFSSKGRSLTAHPIAPV